MDTTARPERRVRCQTINGVVEGSLLVSPRLRTLDDLNNVPSNFVTLYQPVAVETGWPLSGSPVAINKDSILFVTELTAFAGTGGMHPGDHTRSPITLQLSEHLLNGFVHLPPNGDPIVRLNQDTHPFLALTAASVLGPNGPFTAPFVAVNRVHVLVAQQMSGGERETTGEQTGIHTEA